MPNIYTNFVFALTIIVSFAAFTRCRPGRFNKLVFSFLIFLNLFLYLIHKGADYFTGEGIDYATITLFKFGFKGAGVGDYTWHIAFYSGLLTLVLAGLVFFIFRKPAIASGIGEKLEAYQGLEKLKILLVFPGFGVSTAEVYKNLNLGLTKCKNKLRYTLLNNHSFDPRYHLTVHNRLIHI